MTIARRWATVVIATGVLAGACSGGDGKSADPIDEPTTSAGERPVQITSVGNVRLGATFSIPAAATASADAKVPGVLLVPDLGPGDRDGPMSATGAADRLAHDVSTSLTSAGLATLRYDRRGTGDSKIDAATKLSFDDMVADARAGLDFLAERKQTAGAKLAVVGYDDGGVIALRLAATDRRVSRVVLVSTPGRPLVDVQASRLGALYGPASADALRTTVSGLLATGTVPPLDEMRAELRPLLPSAEIPFLTQVYKLDPAAEAAGVNVPVLFVIGSRSTGVTQADADRFVQARGATPTEVATAVNADETLLEVLAPPIADPGDPSSPVHEHGVAPAPPKGNRDTATLNRMTAWLKSGLSSGPG